MVSVRPEELLMHPETGEGIPAVVDDCVFLGLTTHYFLHLTDGMLVEVVKESSLETPYAIGSKVRLTMNEKRINIFTGDGLVNIVEGVVNDVATE